MVKATYVDKNGVKKGAWTEEEDNKLKAYIKRYGHCNWRQLPKFAGLERCGKSCRLRWMNYLKPGLNRGDYSEEERDLIAKLHHELGNKWSAIAAKLPGRTDNDIKNYCHTQLKNPEKRVSKSGQRAEISQQEQFAEGFRGTDPKLCGRMLKKSKESSSSDMFILESSSSNSSTSVVFGTVNSDSDSSAEQNGSDEILPINSGATDDGGSFPDLLVSELHEGLWTQPFIVDTDSYDHDYSFFQLDEGGLLSPRFSCSDNDAINFF